MPNVLNEFAGDGVTQTFNFSMTGGYMSRDYVYFFTRPNDDLLNYTPYNDDDVTWISDYTVRTAAPIPVGYTFVVVRSTPLAPLVDFQNTSRITEKNLDTATAQSIHIAAETSDTVGRIQVVAQDAKQESAQALAGAQAAATSAATAAASAIAASTAASASNESSLQASSDAADAALSAANAAGVADAAAITANAANATAISAAADSAAAVASASNANTTANSAASQAGAAVSTANTALSIANSANTSAGAAVTTANSAAATASTAMTIANEAKDLVDEAVSGAVVSFNGRAGEVMPQAGDYTKAMVGLEYVDNVSAAYLRDRTTHTGAQGISTVTGLQDALDSKVDKVVGKQLSTEDFTTAEKLQLSGLQPVLDSKADNSAVSQAIAMAATFTTVPATFQAWSIVVTQPHLRCMVWDGAKYVRAPWHAPGKLSHFLREVPDGHIEVRSDVVLNTADFPDLAAYLGVSASTFVLDETRGEFLRALDSGRGIDAGRTPGSAQADQNKSHTHTGSTGSGGAHTHTVSGTAASAGAHTHTITGYGNNTQTTNGLSAITGGTAYNYGVAQSAGAHTHTVSGTADSAGAHSHTVTINNDGGTEARPRNKAYRLAVQY